MRNKNPHAQLNGWAKMDEFIFGNFEYRIKPEPTYRPFKDAEECWQEMLRHEPFGWVKEKVSKAFYCIGSFDVANIYVGTTNIIHSYADSLKNFTFADGTPFGSKSGGIVMAWIVVNKIGGELISQTEPFRVGDYWIGYSIFHLPKGSIKKLIGREFLGTISQLN